MAWADSSAYCSHVTQFGAVQPSSVDVVSCSPPPTEEWDPVFDSLSVVRCWTANTSWKWFSESHTTKPHFHVGGYSLKESSLKHLSNGTLLTLLSCVPPKIHAKLNVKKPRNFVLLLCAPTHTIHQQRWKCGEHTADFLHAIDIDISHRLQSAGNLSTPCRRKNKPKLRG